MIQIDLLNPQTVDTYTLTETPSEASAPKRRSSMPSITALVPASLSMPSQAQGLAGIVGINIIILLVLILLINILPAEVGGVIYKAQKVFTRLYNLF